MLRPLFICPNGEFGGGERTAINFGRALQQMESVEPHFALLREGPMEATLSKLGIPFLVTDTFRLSRPFQWTRIMQQLKEYAREKEVNLIHSEMAYGHLVGSVLAKQLELPCTWYQHGPVDPNSWMQIAAALAPSNCLITNSEYTLSTQPRRDSIKKVEIIPPPLDPEFFDRNADGNSIREKLRLGIDDILLLVPGRFQSWKGQAMALSAFPELANADSRLHIAFLGKPNRKDHRDYPEYLSLTRTTEGFSDSVRSRVHFFDFTSDIIPYLDAADIVLHCSQIPEPFGCIITESMARGKVVVAADAGGAKDILQNGEFGFPYTLADTESFQDAIRRAIDSRETWSQLSTRSVERAKYYHSQTLGRQLQTLFQSLVAKEA